jgi:uncharacterized protein involved in exopolysaccharide biosynthesis
MAEPTTDAAARHPAAGTRIDPPAETDDQRDARIKADLTEQVSNLRKRLTDASTRLAHYEAAERDGSCAGCLGRDRTIADLKDERAALRRRLAAAELPGSAGPRKEAGD